MMERSNKLIMADIIPGAAASIGWTVAAQVSRQLTQFAVGIMLARLLSPQDFGLLAMVLVFTAFVATFRDAGLGAALVQRQDVERNHAETVFWSSIGLAVGLTTVLWVSAPAVSILYREARLTLLIRVVACELMFSAPSTVPTALLTRNMRFAELGLIATASSLVGGGVALVAAIHGYGVWSLVWQLIAASIANTIGVWVASRWVPRGAVSMQALNDLRRFGLNLTGFTAVNYWLRNADNLLVGRFIGDVALGLYSRAYSLMLLPINQISGILTKVMFPTLSRLQRDTASLKEAYVRTLSLVGVVSAPIMVGMCVLSEPLVTVLFGSRWMPMVPTLRVLAIVGMFQCAQTTVGWIYQSTGRTDWMFRWALAAGPLLIAGFAIGSYIGTPFAVAVSYGIVSVGVLFYPEFAIAGSLIDLTVGEVLSALIGSYACASIMGAVIIVTQTAHLGELTALLVGTSVGAFVYGACLIVLQPRGFADLLAIITRIVTPDAAVAPSAAGV
jgi:O-antigen/teichoic acid export membrane protein